MKSYSYKYGFLTTYEQPLFFFSNKNLWLYVNHLLLRERHWWQTNFLAGDRFNNRSDWITAEAQIRVLLDVKSLQEVQVEFERGDDVFGLTFNVHVMRDSKDAWDYMEEDYLERVSMGAHFGLEKCSPASNGLRLCKATRQKLASVHTGLPPAVVHAGRLTDRYLVMFYMPMLVREASVLSTGDRFHIEFEPGYDAELTSDGESPT